MNVFGEVSRRAARFTRDVKPHAVVFTASEPSRKRLYRFFAEKAGALFPGYVGIQQHDDTFGFVSESAIEMIPEHELDAFGVQVLESVRIDETLPEWMDESFWEELLHMLVDLSGTQEGVQEHRPGGHDHDQKSHGRPGDGAPAEASADERLKQAAQLKEQAAAMQQELDDLYDQFSRSSDEAEQAGLKKKHEALYAKQSKLLGDAQRLLDSVESERVDALKAKWGTQDEAKSGWSPFFDKWQDVGPEKYDDPIYLREKAAVQAVEDKWDRDIERALTFGELSNEDAAILGYRRGDGKKFEPVPEDLWHVTTAGDAVLSTGLKSRNELGQSSGKGLGGGSDDTISFTDSQSAAHAIYQGMVEAHKVARNEITVRDMLVDAHAKGFADKVIDQRLRWSGKFEPSMLDDLEAAGLERHLGDLMREEGSDPQWDRFQFYKSYSFWRMETTGRLDPLFFSTDVQGFAEVPRDQIQILKVKAKPGVHGLRVPAEKEYRLLTGSAVEVEGVEKFDPKKHGVVERVIEHLPGRHDQQRHGRRGPNLHDAILNQGGFTYDSRGESMVSSGKVVSPYPDREHAFEIAGKSSAEVRSEIEKYVRDNLDLIRATIMSTSAVGTTCRQTVAPTRTVAYT